ncbi:MAG TPA: FG-GAP-like repeat-containing protein, partial [Candidatus Polarisedimenticolia bacterium]|nr:FG-GAP-like repeat-containing protein [Candidatus Polarisedimenticolia bacterium]
DVAVSVDYAAVVILGTGTGGLGAPVTWSAGDPHTTIAAGDLNEDGHLDLILNNRLGTNVSVLYGVGNGTFILPSRYASGNSPEGIAVADVDGDGRPDLVVGCRQSTSGPAGLSYLRNLGNYAFAPPVSMFWGGTPGPGVAIADLNSDGRADLLAWGDGSDDITLFLGLGGGTFGSRMTLPSGDNPVALKVADVTGDGRLDLVVADGNSTDIAVFGGDGNGGFAPHRRYATLPPLNLDLGDFNEDGAPDVVVASWSGPNFLFHRQVSGSGNPPVAVAGPDIVAECSSPAGAAVPLNGGGSTDPDSTPGTNDDIVTYEWFERFGTPTQVLLGTGVALSPTLTFGTHDVTLRVRDSLGLESTDDLLVLVRDTTPPVLSVTIVPDLWPPNHRLVPTTALVDAVDACGSSSVTLVGVTSSEPDDAPGGADGQTTNDIQETSPGTADFDFLLRAERSSSGPGRTYDATYRAVDESGNVALVAGHAFVPHDIGGVTDPVTITLRETPSGTLVEWANVPAADSFDVAIGELATLRAMDPAVGNLPPSCLVSGLHALNTVGFEFDGVPDIGTAWFFVVSYMTPASGFGAESAPYDIEVVVPSNTCP